MLYIWELWVWIRVTRHLKFSFFAMQKKIEGDKRLCKKLPDGGERITRRRKHIEVGLFRDC